MFQERFALRSRIGIVWLVLWLGTCTLESLGQTALRVEGESFSGVLHDNVSNAARQGSGFTPLILKRYSKKNLYKNDAVGLNFEHIFNGAAADRNIAMFTPRKDTCHVNDLGEMKYEIHWPSVGSQWGMEARMLYDLSHEGHVDLIFECEPTLNRYPKDYAAMMWASYMNRAIDRKIHFWGTDGNQTGWVEFGVGSGSDIEVGTVAFAGVKNLPYDKDAQALNIIESKKKRFLVPFYYGLIDGDHDLQTITDKLLYLVLFDRTEEIRFAMWNFYKDETGAPDTHSPAWDWQFVIRNPKVGEQYGYRARVVVKPFEGKSQVWDEYRKWQEDLGVSLPKVEDSQ